MSSKTVVIDISPAGNATVEAKGFAGTSCQDATAEIELVLGGGESKKKRKPEFYQPASTQQGNKLTF